jgi:hypothetical protein
MEHGIDLYEIFDRKTPEQVQKILDDYLMPEGGQETVRYGGEDTSTGSTVDAAFAAMGV